VFNNRR